MSDERTCATCWHCDEGSGSGTCRRCRASGEAVSEYRADPEAIAAHPRARVAELEKERDGWKTAAGRRLGEVARAEANITAAESRASAAVEAHAQLLSRIAGDGTLGAMERASAAEQRAAVLVVELAGVLGAAESFLSPDSSAVDIERLRQRVREARSALAASTAPATGAAPAREGGR